MNFLSYREGPGGSLDPNHSGSMDSPPPSAEPKQEPDSPGEMNGQTKLDDSPPPTIGSGVMAPNPAHSMFTELPKPSSQLQNNPLISSMMGGVANALTGPPGGVGLGVGVGMNNNNDVSGLLPDYHSL